MQGGFSSPILYAKYLNLLAKKEAIPEPLHGNPRLCTSREHLVWGWREIAEPLVVALFCSVQF